VTTQHLISPARPGTTDSGHASARADALLHATNKFLRSEDLPALGRAITDAIHSMFGDVKAAVTLVQPDGSTAVMSTVGLSPVELEGLSDAVQPGTLSPAVIAATEVWSDDPGAVELRELLGAWGGRSGLTVPIRTTAGVAGHFSMMFADERVFDPGFRDAIRSLGAQAGLAHELITAREELRRSSLVLASTVAERTIQLREAITELQSANKAKTEFLSTVSHELRTPMTAILGFSELLLSGDDGPLNPRQHEDATTILASSRRLLELIDDLIDISRIESNQVVLVIQPVPLRALLATVVEELRALAGEKGMELTLDGPAESVILEADHARLHEVFLNLVSNAVKFTGPGGTVRVVAQLETPPEASRGSRGGQIRIDVIDTGIGIPLDEQELIFQKFHRIAGPAYAGTGLGLAIAREFVARHGGRLTVESTIGLGSCFSVVLPMPREAVSAA
jgi:signal transduction histidine kinase